MLSEKHIKTTIRILVKAFPQPSQKHEETVCCAGVREDTNEFLRLFPIRYRRLPKSGQFNRFDQVEMTITKAPDPRKESFRVDEDSIQVVQRGGLSEEAKVRLWMPYIEPSLHHLWERNKEDGQSLGIIRPDPGSLKFYYRPFDEGEDEDKAVAELLYQQQSLLEEPLKPMPKPEYNFYYRYTCDGHPHNHQIHDWEVQAAFFNFRRRYGEEVLDRLVEKYQNDLPGDNLHFIMGTMKAHPQTFIVIGLLRSQFNPLELGAQGQLF